jgi:pimeloyl-ACP methyl ester carboxylesterase
MQIVVDNILLNYKILGNNKNKTILVLHGWGRNIDEWLQTGKVLSRKYKVILLDLPGFGGSSSIPKSPFDIYDYANLVGKFINELKIKKFALLGHSFGGKISIIVASKNESVQKLFLIDPSGLKNMNWTIKFKKSLLNIFNTVLFFLPKRIKDIFVLFVQSKDYREAGILKESFKEIVNQHVYSEAKKIKTPTIIIWGEYDREVPIKMAKELNNLIPKSLVRIVWGSGHSPHLEKTKNFYKILQEYL